MIIWQSIFFQHHISNCGDAVIKHKQGWTGLTTFPLDWSAVLILVLLNVSSKHLILDIVRFGGAPLKMWHILLILWNCCLSLQQLPLSCPLCVIKLAEFNLLKKCSNTNEVLSLAFRFYLPSVWTKKWVLKKVNH